MYKVNNITADSGQTQNVILPDSSVIQLTIEYKPQQYGWFITNFVYGSVKIQGMRICTSPNMLQQFKNQISIGLSCGTTDNGEPTQLEDFSSGYATLYVLTAAEVANFASVLSA